MNNHCAATIIQRSWRKWRRTKIRNSICPITYDRIDQLASVFYTISTNGYKRGYNPNAFDQWIYKSKRLRDPISKESINSIDLIRLDRCLQCCSKSFEYYQTMWSRILLATALEMLDILEADFIRETTSLENAFQVLYNSTENISAFSANIMYLYILNKAKFRSKTNKLLRKYHHDNSAQMAINIIKTFCIASFPYSYFVFHFDNEICLPIIRTFVPRQNLDLGYPVYPLNTLHTHIQFNLVSDEVLDSIT